MTISTYAELQGAVADWLERADLTNRITDFIALAETQFRRNRRMRVSRLMTRNTRTISAGYTSQPTRFIDVVSSVLSDGSSQWRLDPAPQTVLDGMSTIVGTGKPRFWAVVGDQIRYFPAPDTSYTESLTYYQAPESLSDSVTSNWVLAEFPDLYLFGALKEAGPFLKDADLLTMFEAKYASALEELRDSYRTQVGRLRNTELAMLVHDYDGSDLFGDSGAGVTPDPDPDPGDDETPSAFFFTAETDADPSTTYVSNSITVAGIDSGVEVVVTIDTTGILGARGYSKNGAAYTTSPGTAILGDQFTVRLTTEADLGTLFSTTLTIGGVSGTFSVTTAADPAYTASLDFSDARNSMYLPLIAA